MVGAQSAGAVRIEFLESGVAVVHLGAAEERVVTLTSARIQSLREALELIRQRTPKGVVFLGPHAEMFTAGADITVIRDVVDPAVGEKLAREGQGVFDEIEALPCPTVAAISGPCVGGGCEMVLACTYRLISDQKSSTIGLPEVKLGILPGFGGTQRLPRLVGLPKALDIILAGKTLRPKQALACGLVNEIVSYHKLRDRAEHIALGSVKPHPIKVKLLDRVITSTKLGRSFVAKKARAGVAKETKGFYPAPPAALETVLYGLEHGKDAGLRREAVELGRLIVTPESKGLVKIFFLTEAAKGIGKSARKSVEHLHAVVVGAGVMGAGIAAVLAKNESSVILRDTSEQALSRGMAQIREYLGKQKSLSESERSFAINRIEVARGDSPNLGNANFAIEAIFEDIAIKQKVLGEVAKLMPPDAIIATNTSSLSVTEIGAGIENPSRVVGMHFFNPVEKMPLIEIVRGQSTDDRTVAIIAALSSKLGKFPIVVKDVPGFLINRILSPYLNEAAFLLSEGCSVEDIDRAALGFGMPMGPIRLLDEVGLDVAAHVQDSMVRGYGDRMKGPSFAKQLVELGRKGRKGGAGFYDFADKESHPHHDLRRILNITASHSPATRDEITERLILSLVNEAVRCLDEAVAGAPGPDAANQIDLGTVMGMGFPPFRGGLLHYADSLGAKQIHSKLSALERRLGSRFDVAQGIIWRSKANKSFFDRA